MHCLDDTELLDIAEGRRAFAHEIQAHLSTCSECRLVFAAAARGSALSGDTIRDASAPNEEPSWDELGAGVVIAERYELDRFLGTGGMGVVWAAHRIDQGHTAARSKSKSNVALKIARSIDSDLARRFEREARITMTLEHPNIVRTIEILEGTATRGPCLVLPLLEGETLDALFARRGALSLAEAARLLLPVAGALATAHAHGVVHRDLKPQNVFVTKDRVQVLDFGIAKLLPAWGAHSQLTRTGAVLGTPSYMAPEQLFGERDIDARADIWALGAILFRALVGRTPLAGTTVGHILAGLRRGAVEDLGRIAAGLPADVLSVVRGSLLVPKEARLRDVLEFVRVLSRYACDVGA